MTPGLTQQKAEAIADRVLRGMESEAGMWPDYRAFHRQRGGAVYVYRVNGRLSHYTVTPARRPSGRRGDAIAAIAGTLLAL